VGRKRELRTDECDSAAGSTGCRFERCTCEDNDACGFFFCVRANHITVRECVFRGNGKAGVSIGTRDCNNLVEACEILGNGGPGVLVRETPPHTETHSCLVRGCEIRENAGTEGNAQIDVMKCGRDLVFEDNRIAGGGDKVMPGVFADEGTARVYLSGNEFERCDPETAGESFVEERPRFECGHEAVRDIHYRHLCQ
jgi:hypothetical protein